MEHNASGMPSGPAGNEAASRSLPTKTFSLGSSPSADIHIPKVGITPFHAKVVLAPAWVRIVSLDHATIAINDRNHLVSDAYLAMEDTVYLGNTRIPAIDLVKQIRKLIFDQRHFRIKQNFSETDYEQRFLIGTHKQCKVQLPEAPFEGVHAELVMQSGVYRILNYRVCHPVVINGVVMGESGNLKEGDLIEIGRSILYFNGSGLEFRDHPTDFYLHVEDLSVLRGKGNSKKTIVHDISFTLFEGELCGILGLAGSGKSTLIKTLTGYLEPSKGKVLWNKVDFIEHFEFLKRDIAYVPQEDIFHKDLTVQQVMRYCVLLRRKEQMSLQEVDDIITQILDDLGLFETNADLLHIKGDQLSGGQKKRINIAIELITDPKMFFLDEPTSGLSSQDAIQVIELLKSMSLKGKIVVVIIHQPSLEAYKLFDRVLYLYGGGEQVFFGPAFPDSFLFTLGEQAEGASLQPDKILSAISSKPAEFWRNKYDTSDFPERYVSPAKCNDMNMIFYNQESSSGLFGWRQWKILHSRNFVNKIQDRANSLTLFIQAPVIAFLISFVFSKDAEQADFRNSATILFLMVISSVWFGCTNSVRDICSEWDIFLRERKFNLLLLPYLVSKISVSMIVNLVQCLILVFILRKDGNIEAPFIPLLLLLWAVSLCGTSLALLISAFASGFKKRNEVAIGLIPLVLIPMVILGGFVKPNRDMNAFSRGLSMCFVSRWGFESALLMESECSDSKGMIVLENVEVIDRSNSKNFRSLFYPAKYHWSQAKVIFALCILFFFTSALAGILLFYRERTE